MDIHATRIQTAIAAVTALACEEIPPAEMAHRVGALLDEAGVAALATVVTMLVELAAERGGDTPADVMREIGLAIAGYIANCGQ